MNWYLKVFRQYADFNGRARRKEYWMFFLFNMMFAILATILDNLLGTVSSDYGYGFFYAAYGLALFLPALGVAVRRLHDVGKSGWFLLISIIPIIGAIWLIVLMATDGQPGSNQYGLNPKGE